MIYEANPAGRVDMESSKGSCAAAREELTVAKPASKNNTRQKQPENLKNLPFFMFIPPFQWLLRLLCRITGLAKKSLFPGKTLMEAA